ncbi:MAG: hypothetical protein C0626_04895 [Arcobacter sp.]|jgi:hypothetical protein|uniref:tetratricopeptide repeat protein n=1 Tax=uncultured Arcobacter sp. TaxID=165434 RepID=UPI000CB1E498|nr:hypothetical protein [uncultured Arcobacter sp.]PLY10329.1 MAG: hypothetical protein C0626_04895 [Arcobacter sp.]
MFKLILLIGIILFYTGCIPNTYYSTTDDYATGARWYDRGNYEYAVRYWEPLVLKGDCDAENAMGMAYLLGKGKKQNKDKAVALFKKAANGNQQMAQARLGDLYDPMNEGYLYCKTCEKDIVQSYKWYKLSERYAKYDSEKEYAKKLIKITIKKMTKEQIIEGDKLVQNWKPTPKDCNPRQWW